MANTIITKNSSTASAVPTSGDLVQGELAVNVTDKRLFTEDSGGTVVEVGTNPSSIAVAGNATVGGTLGVTGLATLASSTLTANPTLSAGTANGVTYLNGSKVLTSGSALTFDGTTLTGGVLYGTNIRAATSFQLVDSLSTARNVIQLISDDLAIQTGTTAGSRSIYFLTEGTERLRIAATGDVGIGTSSPSVKLDVVSSAGTRQSQSAWTGLVVQRNATEDLTAGINIIGGATTGQSRIDFSDSGANAIGAIVYSHDSNYLRFDANSTERLRLDSSGNLGLGVTPSAWTLPAFQIKNCSLSTSGVNNAQFLVSANSFYDGSNFKYIASDYASYYRQVNSQHQWYTAPSGTAGNAISFTQAMTLTSGGSLYLGATTGLASSVGAGLYIQSSSYVPAGQVTELLGHWMANASDNSGTGGVGIKYYRVPRGGGIQSGTEIRFYTGYTYTPSTTAEVARFDQSGNMMVGTTTYNPVSNNVIGFSVRGQYGETQICTDGAVSGAPLYLNRKTNDGSIVEFRKDGTTVGSFGSRASVYGYFQFGSIGTGIGGTSAHIWLPMVNGDRSDNTTDIGESSYRFDDIYATNGTIQTSDRNEKQDIETLSEAEARVAVACKGLLRKFRWKDAVAEKGDEARIHFGIIAQDLQDAFAAEGLDAGRYAMFISSTWWEAERVVPAVEEVLDDEGNVVTEAVAEHTVVDSYDSAEEAPEGATERTRLGVRYPELLAFIIAAI